MDNLEARDMAFGTVVSRSKHYSNQKVAELVQDLRDAGVIDKFYDDHFTPGVVKRTDFINKYFANKFIENPNLKVLSVGCGFGTYFYDIPHSINASWTNTDLSSVTNIRYTHWNETFDQTNKCHLRNLDLNSDDAMVYLYNCAKTTDVLLAEGVLMYIPKERAKIIIDMGWKNIVFDVLGSNRKLPLGKNHLWTYTENEWNLNIKERLNFDGSEKDSIIYAIQNA